MGYMALFLGRLPQEFLIVTLNRLANRDRRLREKGAQIIVVLVFLRKLFQGFQPSLRLLVRITVRESTAPEIAIHPETPANGVISCAPKLSGLLQEILRQ